MTSYPFVTVDVFTSRRFGGNPVAVFPDGRGLSDADMQALAREFNLSETTFVLPPDNPAHTARVRIFTPGTELPFAGHPNVGTGYVLARQGRDEDNLLLLEEIAGLVEVRVARDGEGEGEVRGATVAAPQALTLGAGLSPEAVAACASLHPADVVTATHPPIEASVGNPVMIAEVAADALAGAAPDIEQFRRAKAQLPNSMNLLLYLYAHDGGRIRSRMFGPLSGIIEDPATGAAAAALAALLLSLDDGEGGAWEITQGVEMGRPSLLRATATRAPDGIRATVGGDCVEMLRGEAMV